MSKPGLMRRTTRRLTHNVLTQRAKAVLRERMLEAGAVAAVVLAEQLLDRLIGIDPVAAELSRLATAARQRHGLFAVLPPLLRHSPLLDGTLLAMLEPVLRGTQGKADPALIEQGREALRKFVEALTKLDAVELDKQRYPRLGEWLSACTTEEDELRVLLKSYLLFLNDFALRTALSVSAEALPAAARRSLDG
ncbi:MAG: hypothetical protein RBU37_05750 [Myxococcota bacterium]|jgi:hypothetical protein|nr:hypothetical protein [Myxococcota bacterium]